MIDNSFLNPSAITPSLLAGWPYYNANTVTVTNTILAPKIEENNPEELKINVKKRQIKFNFVL